MAASSTPTTRGALAAVRRGHRFKILLALLMLLLLAVPIVQTLKAQLSPTLSSGIITGVFVTLLLSAVFAVSRHPRTTIVAGILVVPVIGLQIAGLFIDVGVEFVLRHLFSIGFLGFVIVVILGALFRATQVTFDTIAASLCVYLLLAVTWALVYSLADFLDPGAFVIGEKDALLRFGGESTVDTLYFSLVTMSTLGYGDIVPATSAARMLAATQAVLGQMYLAVLVARLVGMHIAGGAKGPKERNGGRNS